MTREQPSLGEPGVLDGFPVWHVLRGTTFHRVTAPGNGPWWFASDGNGRFDLGPPRGTCYLADDPLVALLESLGALGSSRVLDPVHVVGRAMWMVALPEQCDAADLTARAARGYGVTSELASSTPYPTARRWAAAFAGAGFGGLRYRARHDPAGGRCLAPFGAAGERRRWRKGRPSPIDGHLVARLRDEAGIELVEENPSEQELRDIRD